MKTFKEDEETDEVESSAPDPNEVLKEITNRFLLQLDALVETASRVMPTLLENEKKSREEHTAFFKTFEELPDELSVDDWHTEYQKLEELKHSSIKAIEARRMLPHSFLVSMVSLYDAYFSNVVRQLLILRPEKIRSGEKTISVEQIVRHKTVDEILEEIVNDELDEVLRGSHIEQLEWMAKKFDFKIDFSLPLVQHFIEITERRNICVHSDGRVSRQYVEKCKKLPIEVVAIKKLGEWVPISGTYLRTTRDVLFELGVRFTQAAWRKARPDQSELQTDLLVDTGFRLLTLEDYTLAKNLYSFALELRGLSDLDKRILAINNAIALKLSGNSDAADNLLDKLDWSAAELRFRLGVAVLKEQYDQIPILMAGVPTEGVGSISANDYRTWPLFKQVQSVAIFAEAFQKKFDRPLYSKEDKNLEKASEGDVIEESPDFTEGDEDTVS